MLRRFIFGIGLAILIIITNLYAQQNVNLDWKIHNVGKVLRVVSNQGGDLNFKNASSMGYESLLYCEYPPNSYEEHVGEAGIWIGAIVDGDTSVSVTTSWSSPMEFYPTDLAYDTVWVVSRGDTVDIPYFNNYVGVSDQDFVYRYNDYGPASQRITAHIPLYLDVIETSYAWSSAPLDEMIVYTYYIIPNHNDLGEVYFTHWIDANVGYRGTNWNFGSDDVTSFYPEQHMSVAEDLEDGKIPSSMDGTAVGPVAIRIFPPENYDENSLTWTYHSYTGPSVSPSSYDPTRYARMASGTMSPPEENLQGGTESMMSFGPFNLILGDTLKFSVGMVCGEGLKGALNNVKTLERIVEQDFKVPAPPPVPKVYVETYDGKVKLMWDRQNTNDPDPENYSDPYRADTLSQPFEGYRVFKRTRVSTVDGEPVPWTLLAEYDLADNDFFSNTGLKREFIDYGLLNNLEYYYSVTAFSKPDLELPFPSQESSRALGSVTVVLGPHPPDEIGKVAVVPNPYRGDISYYEYNPPWEKPDGSRPYWMEQDRRVQFINLPANCEIKIYTLAGDLVNTIKHSDPDKGYEDWNLTSSAGQAIASGIYLFTAENRENKNVQVGKFVVIK
ncbi:hypothetical protein KJ762_04455 [bacterium]|nr:hypothetical protein [bacterium]MBU1633746.1 hypothetical protein [bacterium]MBU1874998.1 hypothetical protein [bacterium]